MIITKYAPAVIQEFADKLYVQAQRIVATYTIIGIVLGGVAGQFVGGYSMKTMYAIIGAIIIGLLGFAVGQARAFALRLQAQTALCQMKIEENTRSEKRVIA
jgi:outer membrane lipoprotein SlyB